MAEQTVFPGIIVTGFRVQNLDTGAGRTLEFPEPIREPDFDMERVTSVASRLRIMGDEQFKLTYMLGVMAYTPANARAKARGFTRMKNPFETDFIDVNVTDSRSGKNLVDRTYYEIETNVQK